MKNIFKVGAIAALITLTSIVAVLLPNRVAAQGEPTIVVESITADPGDTEIEVAVNVVNNPGFFAYSLSIDYDKTRLELVDAWEGDDLSGTFNFAERAVFVAGSKRKAVTTDTTILVLCFDVKSDAKAGDAFVTVGYKPGDISNYEEENVDFAITAGKVTVSGEETAELVGSNVNISSDLKLQFYANLAEGDNTTYLKVVDEDGTVTEVKTKTLTPNGYRFSFVVDPSKMADQYVVSLTDGTTDFDKKEYSIQQYCDNLVTKVGVSDDIKSLLANMLEYGAAAQVYKNHNTDNLANSLSWVASEVDGFIQQTGTPTIVGAGDAGAKIFGCGLRMDDTVHIKFNVRATDTDGLSLEIFRKKDGTENWNPVNSADIDSANSITECDAIEYYDLKDSFKAVLKRNGTEIQSITYGVVDYVTIAQDNTSYPGLADLVKRLWVYGEQCCAHK